MTIASVTVDEAVQAATMNQLIANVNASPGRAIFTSNGNWSVPDGVHKFKVTLCGGGSGGWAGYTLVVGEDIQVVSGDPGKSSHMISACFAGIDVGSSYVITIGAGGAGGASSGAHGSQGGDTSFGTALVSPGAAYNSKGSVTSGGGAAQLLYYDHVFAKSSGDRYGDGGLGGVGDTAGSTGQPGICVIEW